MNFLNDQQDDLMTNATIFSGFVALPPASSVVNHDQHYLSSDDGLAQDHYQSGSKPKRRRLEVDETKLLNAIFERNPKPTSKFREQIAGQMGLPPRCIAIWFQNKRAKLKREHVAAPVRRMENAHLMLAFSNNRMPNIAPDPQQPQGNSFFRNVQLQSIPQINVPVQSQSTMANEMSNMQIVQDLSTIPEQVLFSPVHTKSFMDSGIDLGMREFIETPFLTSQPSMLRNSKSMQSLKTSSMLEVHEHEFQRRASCGSMISEEDEEDFRALIEHIRK